MIRKTNHCEKVDRLASLSIMDRLSLTHPASSTIHWQRRIVERMVSDLGGNPDSPGTQTAYRMTHRRFDVQGQAMTTQ
jgi:hypothetical protein